MSRSVPKVSKPREWKDSQGKVVFVEGSSSPAAKPNEFPTTEQMSKIVEDGVANGRKKRITEEETTGKPAAKPPTQRERSVGAYKKQVDDSTFEERELFREAIDAKDAELRGEVPTELPPLEEFKATPFPLECLGTELQTAVVAIAELTECHPDIAAQSILTALSLAIQSQVDVVLPFGAIKPVSLFLITVAKSGERKSSADREAQKMIAGWEVELAKEWSKKKKQSDVLFAELKKQESTIMNNDKLTPEMKADAVGNLKHVQVPAPPALRCQEPTIAGVRDLFVLGCNSLGVCSDEGGEFLGGHAMQKENEKATVSRLSQAWEAEPWDVTRAGGSYHKLIGKRLTMHLMVQPIIADEFFGKRLVQEQGILARCLIAFPPSLSGTRYHKESEVLGYKLGAYHDKLWAIMRAEKTYKDPQCKILNPRQIAFSPEAKIHWNVFGDRNQAYLAENGELTPISGFAEKSREHAARIAALLTYWYDPQANQISGEVFDRALKIVDYYIGQQLAHIKNASYSIALRNAHLLYEWLDNVCKEDYVSKTYLMQMGPNALRGDGRLLAAIELLEDHNLLRPTGPGRMVNGKPAKKSWQVVRGHVFKNSGNSD